MKKSISSISFIVHENSILNCSDNLVCTISGGQDSILLLLSLYHLKRVYNFKLNLLYCNHLWQRNNIYCVWQLLKISYLIEKPITSIITKTQINSEEQAHFWRQRTFLKIANYFYSDSIVVAHTATDQLETALWNFLRGTSPNGLVGLQQQNFFHSNHIKNPLVPSCLYRIPNKNVKFINKKKFFQKNKKYYLTQYKKYQVKTEFSGRSQTSFHLLTHLLLESKINYFLITKKTKKVSLIKRPFLNFYRTTISQLVDKNQIPIIADKTNQSKKILRNKIRLIIMPLFHLYIQNKVESNIKQYIRITTDEQKYLQKIALNLLQEYLKKPTNINCLLVIPVSLQTSCIKNLLEKYSEKQISSQHIEIILKSIS